MAAYTHPSRSLVFGKGFQVLELLQAISEDMDDAHACESLSLFYDQISKPGHSAALEPLFELALASPLFSELFACWSHLHERSASRSDSLSCFIRIVTVMLDVYSKSEQGKGATRLLRTILDGDYGTWLAGYLQRQETRETTLAPSSVALWQTMLGLVQGSDYFLTRILTLMFPMAPSSLLSRHAAQEAEKDHQSAQEEKKERQKGPGFAAMVHSQSEIWFSFLIALLQAVIQSRSLNNLDTERLSPFIHHLHYHLLKQTQLDALAKIEAVLRTARHNGAALSAMIFDQTLLSRALDVFHDPSSERCRADWLSFFTLVFNPHVLAQRTVLAFCRQLKPLQLALDASLILAIFEARQDMYLWIDYWSISPVTLTHAMLSLCQTLLQALRDRFARFHFKSFPTLFHRTNTTAALLNNATNVVMLELLFVFHRCLKHSQAVGPSWTSHLPDIQSYIKLLSTPALLQSEQAHELVWGILAHDTFCDHPALSSAFLTRYMLDAMATTPTPCLRLYYQLSIFHQAKGIDPSPSILVALLKLYQSWKRQPHAWPLDKSSDSSSVRFYALLLQCMTRGLFELLDLQTESERQACRLLLGRVLLVQEASSDPTTWQKIENSFKMVKDTPWLLVQDTTAEVWSSKVAFWHAALTRETLLDRPCDDATVDPALCSLSTVPPIVEDPVWLHVLLSLLQPLPCSSPSSHERADLEACLTWLSRVSIPLHEDAKLASSQHHVVLWILNQPNMLRLLLAKNSKRVFDAFFAALGRGPLEVVNGPVWTCQERYERHLKARLGGANVDPLLLTEIPSALMESFISSTASLSFDLLYRLYGAWDHALPSQVSCRLALALLQQWHAMLDSTAEALELAGPVLAIETQMTGLLQQLSAWDPAMLHDSLNHDMKEALVATLAGIYKCRFNSPSHGHSRSHSREDDTCEKLACLLLSLICTLEKEMLSMHHWSCHWILALESRTLDAYFQLLHFLLSCCIENRSRSTCVPFCLASTSYRRLETLLFSEWMPLYGRLHIESSETAANSSPLRHVVAEATLILLHELDAERSVSEGRAWMDSFSRCHFTTASFLALFQRLVEECAMDKTPFLSQAMQSILSVKANKHLRKDTLIWQWVLETPQLWPHALDWLESKRLRKAGLRFASGSETGLEGVLFRWACQVRHGQFKLPQDGLAQLHAVLQCIQTTSKHHLLYLYFRILLSLDFGSGFDSIFNSQGESFLEVPEWMELIGSIWSLYGESLSELDQCLLSSLAQLESKWQACRERQEKVTRKENGATTASSLPGWGALILSRYGTLSSTADPVYLLVKGLDAKRLKASVARYSFSRKRSSFAPASPEEGYDPLFIAYYTRCTLLLIHRMNMAAFMDWSLVMKMGAHILLFQFPILALSSLDRTVQTVNREIFDLLASLLPPISLADLSDTHRPSADSTRRRPKMKTGALDWQWAFYTLNLHFSDKSASLSPLAHCAVEPAATQGADNTASGLVSLTLPIQSSFYAQLFHVIVQEPESPFYVVFNRYLLKRAVTHPADFGLFYDFLYGELKEEGQECLVDIVLRGLGDAENTKRLSETQWQAMTKDRPIVDHLLVLYSAAPALSDVSCSIVTKLQDTLGQLCDYPPALVYLVKRRKLLDLLRAKVVQWVLRRAEASQLNRADVAHGKQKKSRDVSLASLITKLAALVSCPSMACFFPPEYAIQAQSLVAMLLKSKFY